MQLADVNVLVYAFRTDSPRHAEHRRWLDGVVAYVEAILAQPRAVIIRPGADHWAIFTALCRSSDARGNLVTDAWLAALAIESGCELVTADRDVARFEGLRWRHPIALG